MTQNINLITDLNIQQPSAFNSKLIAKISLAWFAFLFFSYIIALGVNSNKQKTLGNLETTQQKLIAEISSYNQQGLAPLSEQAMSQGTTSPQVKAPTGIKTLLLSSMNSVGFCHYLEDLAKFTPEGVWLKELILSELDNVIIIKGSAISASGTSALLNSLDKSKAFNDKKFNTLQLQKNFESNSTDFAISSIISSPITTAGGNTTNSNETKKNEPTTYKISAGG